MCTHVIHFSCALNYSQLKLRSFSTANYIETLINNRTSKCALDSLLRVHRHVCAHIEMCRMAQSNLDWLWYTASLKMQCQHFQRERRTHIAKYELPYEQRMLADGISSLPHTVCTHGIRYVTKVTDANLWYSARCWRGYLWIGYQQTAETTSVHGCQIRFWELPSVHAIYD